MQAGISSFIRLVAVVSSLAMGIAEGDSQGPPNDWPSFDTEVLSVGRKYDVPAIAGGSPRSQIYYPAAAAPQDAPKMLKSDNVSEQLWGINGVLQHELADLIPLCLPLLDSAKFEVRNHAVEAVIRYGIPKLNVENAPRLLGFSGRLDRHIAAYCWAKYGKESLPVAHLVLSTVIDREPYNRDGIAAPPYGLVLLLEHSGVEEVEHDVAELVRSAERAGEASQHIGLLGCLNGDESAELVGHYLSHEDSLYRREAIKVARRRNLVQYTPLLREIADSPVFTKECKNWQARSLDIAPAEYRRMDGKCSFRSDCILEATQALMKFNDPEVWRRAEAILDGGWLVYHHDIVPAIRATELGKLLAPLKTRWRNEIHAFLETELQEEHRNGPILALAIALSLEADEADRDLLWRLASSERASSASRLLAAVALSKLGEVRAIPILHELLDLANMRRLAGYDRGVPVEFFLDLHELRRNNGDPDPPSSYLMVSTYDSRRQCESLTQAHLDVLHALQRLGENTVAMEPATAFRHETVLAKLIETMAIDGSSVAVSTPDRFELIKEIPRIVDHEITVYNDALVAAFRNPDIRFRGRDRMSIVDALCQLGDKRGLKLASEDPLLFLECAKYIEGGPTITAAYPQFKYNRVKDGIELRQWYRQHRHNLKWDTKTGKFHATDAEVSGRSPVTPSIT